VPKPATTSVAITVATMAMIKRLVIVTRQRG
jgi:hypothetical protein